MGFHLEINSILRTDEPDALAVGQSYTFEKSGSRVFFDDIPVWLTRRDWTALAEIQVESQTREGVGDTAKLSGSFRVLHLYSGAEQRALTDVFRRMYAKDPYIYVLISGPDLAEARSSGSYDPREARGEAFIHASPVEQLTRVANKYYRDVPEPAVLVLEQQVLGDALVWEPSAGSMYPHIYAPVKLEQVHAVVPLVKQDTGMFDIRKQDLEG